MADLKSIIHSDPEIHSGDPVFVGTRVPVRTLLNYIAGGDSLEVFLENFPSVSREQAIAFLDHDWAEWDRQIERDATSGKLDRLMRQALADHASGKTRPL